MNKALIIGAVGMAAFLFAKQSKAAVRNTLPFNDYGGAFDPGSYDFPENEYYGAFDPGSFDEPFNDYGGAFDPGSYDEPFNDYWGAFDPGDYDAVQSDIYDSYDFQGEQNMTNEQRLNAFLFMIRASEHVYPRDVLNDACYNIFYGGSYFENMIDHPVITGEKVGVPLPAAMCRASGFASGKCVSTAAGAYQIIKPTWSAIRAASPRLNDFSPASQDEAARRLLAQCGALPLIYAGDITGAIQKASKLWASLPGSTAQQNPKSLSFALARFNEGLSVA